MDGPVYACPDCGHISNYTPDHECRPTPEHDPQLRGIAPAGDERYWIAYNGWMGNGSIGVIVKAPRREAAILAAQEALRAAVPIHEATYFEITSCHEITLPHVCEID